MNHQEHIPWRYIQSKHLFRIFSGSQNRNHILAERWGGKPEPWPGLHAENAGPKFRHPHRLFRWIPAIPLISLLWRHHD